MRSPRWRRNRRLKCGCGGYHFPHRKGGGACDHSPTTRLHWAIRGKDPQEIFEARQELAARRATVNSTGVCPF